MSGVKLVNVCKTIRRKRILENINLEMAPGRIYGLHGRNGSGKTMLIRTISGLIVPTSGQVFVFDKQVGKDVAFPESMGLIIENVGFWPSFTGIECLKYIASIKKKIKMDDICNAMKRVGLEPYDKRIYKHYSLGMKQKLAIAQAIMEKPNLILLDEPTNSLDEEAIDSVRTLLGEERERGAVIVVCSHNKEDINLLADEKIKMDDGIIKQMSGDEL